MRRAVSEVESALSGVRLFELAPHLDERGFFVEVFRREWLELLGLPEFVQENHSRSRKNVLRGLHFQVGRGQAKLVRVTRGAIFDVVVDVRASSPTYGRWQGFLLDDVAHRMLYVPVGFAHGFCCLRESDVIYKTSVVYDPTAERSLIWNDPSVGIQWPVEDPIVSARDADAPTLEDLAASLDGWL